MERIDDLDVDVTMIPYSVVEFERVRTCS